MGRRPRVREPKTLGFGDDVARLYANRAERDNTQTHRQIRAAREGIRARQEPSDWEHLAGELGEYWQRR